MEIFSIAECDLECYQSTAEVPLDNYGIAGPEQYISQNSPVASWLSFTR